MDNPTRQRIRWAASAANPNIVTRALCSVDALTTDAYGVQYRLREQRKGWTLVCAAGHKERKTLRKARRLK